MTRSWLNPIGITISPARFLCLKLRGPAAIKKRASKWQIFHLTFGVRFLLSPRFYRLAAGKSTPGLNRDRRSPGRKIGPVGKENNLTFAGQELQRSPDLSQAPGIAV